MLVLNDVLSADEVARLRESLSHVPFRDGRITAGRVASAVKQNEQADGSHPEVAALARLVKSALDRQPTFSALVRPARWSNLMFSCYVTGDRYGRHTDDASMCDEHGWPLRTDVSFTVLLSGPDEYEGGALRFSDRTNGMSFRPACGSAILYPTGILHEVEPVTRGERMACVGWVQSSIRRADQRELLFDLECVRDKLTAEDAQLLLDKAIGNLLRMWGEN